MSRYITVPINVEYLTEVMKNAGITQAAAASEIGHTTTYLNKAFSRRYMPIADLKALCMEIGADYTKATTIPQDTANQDTRGGAEQPAVSDQTKEIISYIQDLGKIQTDLLREVKELRQDMYKMLTALNTNMIDCTTELHQTAEAVRNHSVATNQNMNKMYNQMKYGGK